MSDTNSKGLLTKDQLLKVLPKRLKGNYTDDLLDTVNNCTEDQSFREYYRDNILSYTGVISEGRYKLSAYMNAVKFVSHKLLGDNDITAYTKTFPDRYQRLVDEGNDQNTISSYCSAYKKTQLVQKVFEQSIVPTHILNADIYQEAINVQAKLMLTARSEKVRSDAAAHLMKELKPPEAQKIELDIGIKQDQSLTDLREATKELAREAHRQLSEGNVSAMEIAQSTIVKEVNKLDD